MKINRRVFIEGKRVFHRRVKINSKNLLTREWNGEKVDTSQGKRDERNGGQLLVRDADKAGNTYRLGRAKLKGKGQTLPQLEETQCRPLG